MHVWKHSEIYQAKIIAYVEIEHGFDQTIQQVVVMFV